MERLQLPVPQWLPQVSQGCGVVQMLVELRSDAPDHDPVRASLFKSSSRRRCRPRTQWAKTIFREGRGSTAEWRAVQGESAFAPAPGSALFLLRYAIAALVRAANLFCVL